MCVLSGSVQLLARVCMYVIVLSGSFLVVVVIVAAELLVIRLMWGFYSYSILLGSTIEKPTSKTERYAKRNP